MRAYRIVVSVAVLALTATNLFAQGKVYQWTDENGQVHFSDMPPPSRSNVEEKRVFTGRPDATLPFSLRQLSTDFPVTLYVSQNCGEWCDRARALLTGRGIPFSETELATEEDVNAFRALFGGDPLVPAATVGNRQLKGFAESSWNTLLDQVGYPREPLPLQ